MPEVRVRFAPSPTGYLHVGGARTALFNWLFARHHGGAFILRVEDTDAERSNLESVRAILEGMEWLGLTWDEGPQVGGGCGPYFQSERRETYRAEAERLVAMGRAYWCDCTPEEVAAKRKQAEAEKRPYRYDRTCMNLTAEQRRARAAEGRPRALRFVTEPGESGWDDLIKGRLEFDNANFDDFIIYRSNGLPVYNFACVVDDAAMRISHVVRGDDHVSNTPRQIMMYRALGCPEPRFGHLPMILGADGVKLSKRHGAVAVGDYGKLGYLPEAMRNFLALLGWAWDGTQEIFGPSELVEKFDFDRVNKSPSIFNMDKLYWMNGEYMKALPLPERTALVRAHLLEQGLWQAGESVEREAWLGRIVDSLGERLKLTTQFPEYADFLLHAEIQLTPEILKAMAGRPSAAAILGKLEGVLATFESFTVAGLEPPVRSIAEELGVKAGDVINVARYALSGKKIGPGIFDVMALLGRER
ncbi:MAG: glutamate--tRNA ligase, partial [Candidatus Eisenbacteria bacterium]|nr:glutamate--tRNA ligase [Candidatus Eisenbacteria bacterium]